MKNRNYKVCRDNIYVGQVVKTDNVYQKINTNSCPNKSDQLTAGNHHFYRSILFTPNAGNLANDLLYQSPTYPILNITDDKTCLGLENSIVVTDACNLAPLLEYFRYNKELSYKDLLNIRKQFFTGEFAKDNCELFGFKEIGQEDHIYFKRGIQITDPKKLKLKMLKEKIKNQYYGYRTFTKCNQNVLPREYFDSLDKFGDMYARWWHKKINAFAPSPNEGHIRKLSKH